MGDFQHLRTVWWREQTRLKQLLRKPIEENDEIELVSLLYTKTPRECRFSPTHLMLSRNLRDILPTTENALNLQNVDINKTLFS
ncbi:hypothetical protein WA026_016194 [Henosepilachna vigintioctopunctata]|uniref:Uncharacterized protein n=1 Tax=Henosepilachna vigintioctopunctata TaxID=420089 RepID=A0AAW1TP84_9CUCU